MVDWVEAIRAVFSEQGAFVASIGILLLGLVLGTVVWRQTTKFLRSFGVPDAVEGTPFERTARGLGTSTVGVVAAIAALFVYVTTTVIAINIAQLGNPELFWSRFTAYLPRLFVAALAVILGLVLGDKAGIYVSERLRSVKLPEVSVIPKLVKYSIFYVAGLIALAQLGVAIGALLVLLRVYALGLVILALLAFWDLLRSGAAGIYLLLTEPYSIGDRIRIGDNEGIVQEVDVFTTRIENEGEEYIVPNQKVFKAGIVRIRE
jgi:small-conductance mechanosensitive channel